MWRLKLLIKGLVGLYPRINRALHGIGVFKHGSMKSLDYVQEVIFRHMDNANLASFLGMRVIEVGPGDSVLSGLMGRFLGADSVCLIDADNYAHKNLTTYRSYVSRLSCEYGSAPFVKCLSAIDFLSFLKSANIRYETKGVQSFREVNTDEVDFLWSHSVVQHIALDEVGLFFDEVYRVLKPGASSSHRIDFRDMLTGGLVNLTFPSWFLDSAFYRATTCYVNGLRFSQLVGLAEQSGFRVFIERIDRFDKPQFSRERLSSRFSCLSDEDLSISGCDIRLVKI